MLLAGQRFPGALLAYVVQAREQAKDIIWSPLMDIDAEFNLGLRFRENDGTVILPNKSRIKLFGAGSMREINKLRGKKYPIVCIDEAQLFTGNSLEYLLEDVIAPATADYGKDSQIVLTGTPNAACHGHFHKLWFEGHGTKHHWTMLQNPHMPNPEEWMAEKRRRSGWDEKHPTYMREYLGQWIRDQLGLVYDYTPSRNLLPHSFDYYKEAASDWSFTLGVDVGVRSATAYVVIAHSLELNKALVVRTIKYGGKKRPSASPASRIASTIEALNTRYDFHKQIMDTGGMGAAFAETLKLDHGTFVEAAKKSEKLAHIEMCNSDLKSGVLQICAPENEELIEELKVLQWDADKFELGTMVEDRNYDNHAADAMLYSWRGGYHHEFDPEFVLGPKKGSKEWDQAERDKEFEAGLRQFYPSDYAFEQDSPDYPMLDSQQLWELGHPAT